ncbi:copper resistance protein NlpE [Aequorivita ciconiae]|nr:copper resistance protein NlpE [Aequorivita sp. H23M31]
MKNSALILGFATFVLFGCKSGEKHEMVFDGPIETVSPKADRANKKETLDWAGVYEATSPCADCDGIKTTVELKTDKTFNMSQTRIGKTGDDIRFKESGNFTWEDNGSDVVLEAGKYRIKFEVGQNDLTLLDMSGNVAKGELSNFYVLKKK